jgi:hypothetical protein
VSNKDSKFYEILVPFEGEDISLKDYVENTIINPEEVEFEEQAKKEGEEIKGYCKNQ